MANGVDVTEKYEFIIGEGLQKANVRSIESDAYPKPLAETNQFQSNRNSTELNFSVQQVITRHHQYFDKHSPRYSYNNNCYICDSPDLFIRDCPHKYQTRNIKSKGDRLKLVRTIRHKGNDGPAIQRVKNKRRIYTACFRLRNKRRPIWGKLAVNETCAKFYDYQVNILVDSGCTISLISKTGF